MGRRGLERLRTALSERDLAVLEDVARCRVMTGRQLQQLYFPLGVHATLPSAARSARRVLRRLVDCKLLVTLDRRIGGVSGGSQGLLYRVGPVGQRLLRDGRASTYREPSTLFVDHALAVADIFVRLRLAEGEGRLRLLRLQVEAEAARRFPGLGGGELLTPDLFVHLTSGEEELAWFVEVDRDTEHRSSLLAKGQRYLAYYRSGREQQRLDGLFPRLLFIVPDQRRATFVRQTLKALDQAVPGLVVVVTGDTADAVLQGGRPPPGPSA